VTIYAVSRGVKSVFQYLAYLLIKLLNVPVAFHTVLFVKSAIYYYIKIMVVKLCHTVKITVG